MFGYPRLKLRKKRGTTHYYVMLARMPFWSQKLMRFLTAEDALRWLRKNGDAWLANYRTGRPRQEAVPGLSPAE